MTASSAVGTTYNYAVIFLVALGSFTYGFNASIMGTVFGLSSFYTYFDLYTTGPGADHANTILGGTTPQSILHNYHLLTEYLANSHSRTVLRRWYHRLLRRGLDRKHAWQKT